MTVTTDFHLALGDAREAVMPGQPERPGMQRRLEAALADLDEAAAPAACYEVHPIERVLHERLELAGGVRIGGGPLTSLVGGADELYVAVCTLGAALDERIRAHRAEGRYLEMLLLDELGSWAVDQVREQLYAQVRGEVSDSGRHLSGALSPGESSAWPIREQRKLFRLVDATQIGVSLGAGDLMSPIKSISLVFGAGAEPLDDGAVDQVREQLYAQVRAEVSDSGRHLSGALSPGESASWPIREQRKLFRLVDATQIGVSLGAGDLMSPIKSISLVFGAGAEPLDDGAVSRCHYCSIRDRCRYAA